MNRLKFIGTKAPYGYVKDPADKNHLLIDERFSPTVRYIFKLVKDGIVINQIARQLRSEKRKPAQSAGTFIVEEIHEPIIDPKEWELVQRLITSRKKVRRVDIQYDNIFSGMMKCADCGFALTYVRVCRNCNSENIYTNYDYQCNKYQIEGKSVCTQHRITALNLYNAVLTDIKRLAGETLGDDKQMISAIAARLGKSEKRKCATSRA